eukprot:CCRYP_011078-RA/>CCRYP_011078-RA protein AED:0.03 eAED:0.03 QI:370/1/1/1/1/1/2/382/181
MGFKDIKEFSAEEVGLWLTVQGLGEKAETFMAEGVDGNLLVSLTLDEFKNDLGLSGLQAKKVMKNIEFTKELGNGGGGDSGELEEKIRALRRENEVLEDKVESLQGTIVERDAEIKQLRRKIESLSPHKKEVHAAPAPVHHHSPSPAPQRQPQGMPVVRNAAVGTATGAVSFTVRFICFYF